MKPLSSKRLVKYLEELKSEEVKRRTSAVRHLHMIAEAFGPEKTLKTILPFLKEYENDEEEVLIELARQLELLGNILSRAAELTTEIVPYYYIVLSYEDMSVVNEGMMSLKRLVVRHGLKHESLAVLAKELLAIATPKALASAIRIFCELNGYIARKHFDLIRKAVEDNLTNVNCVVRKETAVALRYLVSDDDEYTKIAIKGLKTLFNDPQDTVKVHALESLCKQKTNKSVMPVVIPIVLDPSVRKSWRLRYVAAAHVLRILDFATSRAPLVDMFVSLLLDDELEVTVKAVASLRKSAKSLREDEVVEKVLPAFKTIATSKDVERKAAVAGSVLYLAPVVGKSQSNEHIKEILVSLLKDENSSIRVELLKNHEPLATVLPLSSLVNILNPVFKRLLGDKDWKVREQGVIALERYLIKLGDVYCSSDSVLDDIKANLRDRVYSVRQAALGLVYGLSERFGEKWTEKYALALLSSFAKNGNYLMRLNYVCGLRMIFKLLSPDVLKKEAETVSQLCNDRVANVRFQALLALLFFFEYAEDPDIEKLILAVCGELEKDKDSDVQSLVRELIIALDFKTCVRKLILEKAK